jgi:hypothetical protein
MQARVRTHWKMSCLTCSNALSTALGVRAYKQS